MFEAYRTLGLITGELGFTHHFEGKDAYLTVPLGKSFLTYRADSLRIRFLGPQFQRKVNSASAYKDLVLVAVGSEVSAWHKVKQVRTYEGSDSGISEILVFGNYLLALNYSAQLVVWNAENGELLGKVPLPHEGLAMVHPPTYLNKALVVTKGKGLILVNVKTAQKIYDFPNICKQLSGEILSIEQSPALDVVALGLETGSIVFANTLKDTYLFELKQTTSVTSLSFCTEAGREILATGCENGEVLIWDLPNKRIQSTVTAHKNLCVSKVFFLPGEPVLTTASGADNSLKQWIFDLDNPDPRLLRERTGFNSSPSYIRFYDSKHLLACSSNSLRDLSILNEHQSTNFSYKHIHKTLKKAKVAFGLNPFKEFGFSLTREKDWCNVLTCHEEQDMAFLWSYENKALGNKPVETKDKSFVTSCVVSFCGNYGVVGFSSGKIEKFNMQSGLHQFQFKASHTSQVLSLKLDSLNRILVSASSSSVNFWCFLTGKLLRYIPVANVKFIELDKFSNLLGVATAGSLLLYDIRTCALVRQFECKDSKDLAFSHDSRWVAAIESRTVKVWDIPSDRLIDWVSFEKPPVSLAFSPSGEYLATAHKESLGVFLWINKSHYQNVIVEKSPTQPHKLKGFDIKKGKDFYSTKPIKLENLVTQPIDYLEKPVQIDKMPEKPEFDTLELSDLPLYRVQALHNIDYVKERNKPIQPPKKPEKVPFFLPDSLNIVKKPETQETSTEKPKLEEPSELTPHLEHSPESITSFLKTLSPGKIELAIVQLTEEQVPMFTDFLEKALASKKDFDFLQSLLSCFLKVHSDELTQLSIQKLSELETGLWESLEQEFLIDLSGLERLI